MQRGGCISESDLRAFSLGDLPEWMGRTVAAHLDDCEACEAVACQFDELSDPVIERLRRDFHADTLAWPARTGRGSEPSIRHAPAEIPRHIEGFEILDVVGRGGMSVVYRAHQASPSRVVALKMLLGGLHSNPEQRSRLLAEADAFARTRHANVVQIHGVGDHEGIPFLVLEYVGGGTLIDRLGGTPLPPRQAAVWTEQVARAVHFAHSAGVVHRDLKPANILLDADGMPKVADFGLAKQPENDLTATGAVMGTPQYMAPEQAEGKTREVGPAADLYALGAILYEMLTGRPPFRGATPMETLDQVRSREPVPPSQLRAKMPRDLETICLTCLNKSPAARYRSAEALADDLGRYLRGEPVSARRIGTIASTWRWCKRNPAVATLLGVVTTLLVSLALGAFWTALRFRAIAEAAGNEARERLVQSKVAEARAIRASGMIGQRFESLRLLGEAARIAREARWPESRVDPLRNDAIVSLTRFDVRDGGPWGSLPRGGRSYYLSPDATTEVWDVGRSTFTVRKIAGRREVARLTCPSSGGTFSVLMSRDSRFIAIWARTEVNKAALRAWDLDRPGSPPTISLDGDVEFLCWSFSNDGRQFAFGRRSGAVAIHDPADGRELRVIQTGRLPDSLAFHPSRPLLAISSENRVDVHDLERGAPPILLPQSNVARGLVWHPRRDILTVAVDDYKLHLWDIATRKEVMTLEGFKEDGIFASFDHTGDLLSTHEWGHSGRFWDLRTGRQILLTPDEHPLKITDDAHEMAFTPNRTDGTWHRSDLADRSPFRVFMRNASLSPTTFKDCAFSPRMPILAAAMGDGFGLWDLQTGHLLARHVLPRGAMGVAFEASGTLIVHGPDGIARWPFRDDPAEPNSGRFGPPQPLVPPLTVDVQGFSASRDGSVLARAEVPRVTVWHPGREGPHEELSPHNDVRIVEVSPDGKWVVTVSHSQGVVKVWDADTGRLRKQFPPEITTFGFSADGLRLATAGDRLRIWEVGAWEEIPLPVPATGRIDGILFSPDGRLIAANSGDGWIRLINPSTGGEIARLEAPARESLRSLRFSPDGIMLAGSADYQSLHVWDLRAIRRELSAIGLDWDLPAYPAASATAPGAVSIRIDAGSP